MTHAVSIETFFDKATSTLTYIAYDATSKDAVIIDPVLDFDPASGVCSTESIEKILAFVNQKSLRIHYILETHAHADHLSSSRFLLEHYFPQAKAAIGERITVVQSTFKSILNLPESFPTSGSQFTKLFKDEDEIKAGTLTFRVLFTPGHTPACVSYLFSEAVFTGDALFMPDSGTGRCDFPDGDARALYHSIAERLYKLPDSTHVFVGHDYQPGGRELAFETTIGASKAKNIQLKAETSEVDYVTFRINRDRTLNAPTLLFPSIQVNIAAGALPPPESNGQSYLKLPIRMK